MSRARRLLAAAAAVAVAALVVFAGTSDYRALVGSLAVVYALLALGFVVLTGWAGDVSLGQVVPYGLGGYATYALSHRLDVPVALAVFLAVIVTLPVIALIGLPVLRLRGLDLAVATLALALVFQLFVFRDVSRWLGPKVAALTQFSSSVVRVGRPHVGGLSLSGNKAFYVGALVVGAASVVAVAALGRTRFARGLRAVRDDALRAEVVGIPVAGYRLAAFVIAGALAALAGAVAASLRQALTPDTFTIFDSLNFLAFAVIGGLLSAPGAILGGGFAAGLGELVRVHGFRFLEGRLTLVYGIGLVVVLAARPGGLASLVGWDRPRRRRERSRALSTSPAPRPRRALRGLLHLDELTVTFGAVRAVDRVSLRVGDGESVALIGPNGAGKTTLFDAVTGLVPPNSGRLFFAGYDVVAWAPHRRAAAGLARTFQTVRAFPQLTVADNLDAAAHLRGAAPPGRRRLLAQLHLEEWADRVPSELPFGALRALEIGLALAAEPRLVLLDEPTAGLTPDDAAALCDLLARLHDERGETLLLVEHDMGVVGRLADRVVVLDRGAVIADGSPAAIAADPTVVASYLGTSAAELATPGTRRRVKEAAGARGS